METKTMKKFCLFSGRHELPENEGALFSEFDFNQFTPVATENYAQALEEVKNGGVVGIYVTGLTPALTYFLSQVREYSGKVVLLHFNSQTQQYVEQLF